MEPKILDQVFFGNQVLDYLVFVMALLFGLLTVKVVAYFFVKRLKKFSETTATTLDDLLATILEKIVVPVLYLTCFYLASKILKLPAGLDSVINVLQLAVITFFSARIIILLLGYSLKMYLTKKQEDPALARSLDGMLNVVKFLIWSLALIIFLDNIGFKVTTMIAGLGIGGIAVAIAAQALLKDFFGYFSIVFDRPFKLGDFIVIGDFMGSVEYIGIKTTRLRSLGGEQLIFSNTDLTDSRVRNYKRMEKRRVVFSLGVTYQTSLDQLKELPKIIEKVIRETKDTAFDRAHFFSYGDFSLIFEVVYFILSPDYNKYMDVRQEINFAVKEEFEKRGIEFAYPTQTLYVQKT
ncbi:mechanosensitive ion channel protein MscS [candidate division WOR-1 bacterium RIFOXYA12_FULL_43_27]|uniref:Mechanosensitive ion channel protein MscS n=1 Tax=candidate division WOR-1 bacterium RIFOXYC2_FULL_46_14 TaxID=1802587 RepID=A0A1F4U6D3_UNCSA|nr:MAG: mechanosensitive ion channel protein MscS [candidate division WOR-1 bacterium RIFOXYA12_FULL_43_27]OGC20606.1 MAG: mechanosensitive ion channel protein MscS [candidate division WOR-1 bacterium RIFOXYB2_FULL_46_45]OGC31657.1 MAG: mechanosensitive ion channel protein MscS [candidate division WOR-1 bacterium RIFOXYA2_FULL_46_56]OGC40447.1 MAG: mechanosensitive ion channel protein MscS [candidate division WOR-1 bacterium RIFOXYC2_FULL_46_14]